MCVQIPVLDKVGEQQVAEVVADLLENVVQNSSEESEVSVFDAREAPAISLLGYLQRWFSHVDCGPEVLVIAVTYIDRLGMEITSTNVHRILLAALVVAAKWHLDTVPANTHLAAVGGVAAAELSRLEICFLHEIEWETHVEPRIFGKYMKQFRKHPKFAREL